MCELLCLIVITREHVFRLCSSSTVLHPRNLKRMNERLSSDKLIRRQAGATVWFIETIVHGSKVSQKKIHSELSPTFCHGPGQFSSPWILCTCIKELKQTHLAIQNTTGHGQGCDVCKGAPRTCLYGMVV